jgi:methylthioribose-1-phosphate isomerase
MTQQLKPIDEKLNDIFQIIKDIEIEDDPGVSTVLLDGFILSLNIIKELSEKSNPAETLDISEQIQMVTRCLGVNLEELVVHIVKQMNEGQDGNSDKPVDQNTLDFIISNSDLDDYEKFLAENKAKEDLDFLSKAI